MWEEYEITPGNAAQYALEEEKRGREAVRGKELALSLSAGF